ncbi:MAG: hypothetical protein M5R40_05215 [Anaerolineae bacterium]|nr:hypothetical protein [Anaerolineae bacterium]
MRLYESWLVSICPIASSSLSCLTPKLLTPMARTFPCAFSFSSAPIVSAIGIFGLGQCTWYRSM